jgi:replicative DNA helicase
LENETRAPLQSVDERLIALAILRTGGAREIFRRIKDEAQLEGWDNRELYIACREVFDVMGRRAMILQPDLILTKLDERGSRERIGEDKLSRILNAVLDPQELEATISAVQGRKQSRDMASKVSELRDKMNSRDVVVDDVSSLAKQIVDLQKIKHEQASDRLISLHEILEEIDHIEEMPDTVATGFPILDEALGGGLLKGSYSIIAGHTGTGKSIAALTMYMNMLRAGLKPIYINYEVARPLFFKFLFAQLTGCNVMSKKSKSERYMKEKKEEAISIIEDLYERGLLLLADPMSGSSKMWNDVEDMLRDLTDIHSADCVFFDTINSVYAKTGGQQGARWNEYEHIAIASERMFLELNIPGAYTAQPKQEVVLRDDKTPMLYDVAGGKVISEKAAAILHLHRTDLLNPGEIDYSEFIITKNRVMGQELGTAPIRVKYDPDRKSLYELPRQSQTTSVMDLTGELYEGPFLDGSSLPSAIPPVYIPEDV